MMYHAKYGEWLASLFGACAIAFGLGLLLADYVSDFAPVFIVIGGLIHAWGMYRTHKTNRSK